MVPPISKTASFFYSNLYWKKTHALVLTVDPGLEMVQFALSYLAQSRHEEDTLACGTATASWCPDKLQPKNTLQDMLTIECIGEDDSSDEEMNCETRSEYPPGLCDVSRMVRGLVTVGARGANALLPVALANSSVLGENKRKRTAPTFALGLAEEIEQLDTHSSTGSHGSAVRVVSQMAVRV